MSGAVNGAVDVRETKVRIARMVVERVANGTDIATLDELYDAPRVRDGMEERWSAFPDLHSTIECMIADGDTVSCWISARGPHGGTWHGLEPPGRRVETRGSPSLLLPDRRILDLCVCFNGVSMWDRLTDATAQRERVS